MNFTCRFHDQRNFYNVCITKSEVASCWKLFLHKTELYNVAIFYLTSSRGRIHLCVSNPMFKITIFRMTIEVPSRVYNCPDRFSPVSATTSTGSPRCSVSTCLSRSCLLLVGGKIEANSIEATNCCDSIFFVCHNSQHYVAFDFWIDSRSGEALGHSLLP